MSTLEDLKWVRENNIELVKKYDKKWVAIKDKNIIEVAKSLNELKEKMKKRKEEEYIFEYINSTLFPSWDRG
ncbi:MAG: DUF5678 domain-containing protein [Candidatus Aenigmatarchaeota archaeon]|nr:hypothetical protein [Candidatus Aenigmarchaeota archaeon]